MIRLILVNAMESYNQHRVHYDKNPNTLIEV